MTATNKITIGLVGVCASGKSTLKKGLAERRISVRHIAQEHSYVKDMWKKITNPDVLIFLDANFETTLKRKRADFWLERDYLEQLNRLSHAREHADFELATDELSPLEVLDLVCQYLNPYLSNE